MHSSPHACSCCAPSKCVAFRVALRVRALSLIGRWAFPLPPLGLRVTQGSLVTSLFLACWRQAKCCHVPNIEKRDRLTCTRGQCLHRWSCDGGLHGLHGYMVYIVVVVYAGYTWFTWLWWCMRGVQAVAGLRVPGEPLKRERGTGFLAYGFRFRHLQSCAGGKTVHACARFLQSALLSYLRLLAV